jgi:hypothetical protein
MSKLYFTFILWLFSISSNAQVTFNNKYYEDDALRAEDLIIDSNELIVIGNKHMGFPGFEGFLHRIDQNGVLAASKIYNAQGGLRLNKIIQLSDSTFMAVGELVNPQSQVKNGLCLRLNSQGDTIWTRTFAFGSFDVVAQDLSEVSDSIVVVVGDAGPHAFVLGLRPSGAVEWSWVKESGASEITSFNAVANDSSGNFLVAGAYSSQMVNPSGILLNVDTTGSIIWSKQVDGISSFREIHSTANALYLYDDANLVLSKIDFNGTIQWSGVYSSFFTEGMGNDLSISEDTSGHILLTANDGFYGNLVQIDEVGNILNNQQVIGKSINGQFNADGNLIVLGNGPVLGVKSSFVQIPHYGVTSGPGFCSFSTSPIFATTSVNLSAITFLPNGLLSESLVPISVHSSSAMQEDGCIEILGGTNEFDQDNNFILTPNPTNGKFTIKGLTSENVTIFILDTKGNEIFVGNLAEIESQLDLSSIEAGCYFVRIGNNVQKLVLTK